MSSHIRKLHKDKVFSCLKCNFSFLNEDTLSSHVKSFHPEVEGKFKCDLCRTTFKKNRLLQMHLKNVHSGIRHICPECRSTFCSKESLARHVKTQHGIKCEEMSGIAETYKVNGKVASDVTTKAEYVDEDNNVMIMEQENNSMEEP